MNEKNKPYEWLERRIAKPGPFLCLCLTQEETDHAAKGLTKWPLPFPEFGATAHLFIKDGTNTPVAIITLSKDAQETNSAIEVAGMLVHEAVHVWQYYAEKMGETRPGDEQEAYAIQAISQELLAEYARRLDEVI